MEVRNRWKTPREIEASWQIHAAKIVSRPHNRERNNPLSTLGENFSQTALARWTTELPTRVTQIINGPLDSRLDRMQQNPQKFTKHFEQTVYRELRRSAADVEDTFLTRASEVFPWIVAAAGFIPVFGAFVIIPANLFNTLRAGVQRSPRKMLVYGICTPLHAASILIPPIGAVTNTIFMEEMNRHYGIALAHGELQILSGTAGRLPAISQAVDHAVERFEKQQEKKNARRKRKVPALTAVGVLDLQLKRKRTFEEEVSKKEQPRGSDRRKLVRLQKQTYNTEALLSLVQPIDARRQLTTQ